MNWTDRIEILRIFIVWLFGSVVFGWLASKLLDKISRCDSKQRGRWKE